MHYRLVAGVIELPPEIEMIAQEMQRVGWSTDQGRNYLKKHFGDILPTPTADSTERASRFIGEPSQEPSALAKRAARHADTGCPTA
jgi:hypothetical protein